MHQVSEKRCCPERNLSFYESRNRTLEGSGQRQHYLEASHQTGWTGTVANLIQLFGHLKKEDMLAGMLKRGYSEDVEVDHR
jgi:hypothetical protein